MSVLKAKAKMISNARMAKMRGASDGLRDRDRFKDARLCNLLINYFLNLLRQQRAPAWFAERALSPPLRQATRLPMCRG